MRGRQIMDQKKQVQQTFGKNASKYVSSRTHSTGEDLKSMIDWLRPTKDTVALDIATGGGHTAKALASHVKSIFVTDLTKEMVEHSRQSIDADNAYYIVADAEQLPFIDHSFDLVTCRIAAHHFPHPEQFIKEVKRVLKPGGHFLFIDNVSPEQEMYAQFFHTFEKERDPSHARALSIQEWSTLLNRHALRIKIESSRKKELEFREWVERTVESKEKQGEIESYFLDASESIASYITVKVTDDQVDSFTVDEWMVIAEKR
ncbi:methylase [Pontibacillus halophilus JSM 076056 = DSM 19796]|uniref:Methylase n=2 Tax=Pontibacillus TaxID=289201 RepID=A0A0A5GLF0_9BACI|nr:class I SAM-dependent methyltransferase [Pontibacillus halophilus]KGX92023.1 methylase [Pontibacillus halophilus JSM 076056 = DSM 19796]